MQTNRVNIVPGRYTVAENVHLNTYTAGKEEFVRLEAEHWDNRVTKLKK